MKLAKELFSMDLPAELQTRFKLNADANEDLQKKYPKHTLFSYQTRAMHLWNFLMDELGMNLPPPPIVIDRRKHPPRLHSSVGKPVNWMNGSFNFAVIHDKEPEEGATMMFPIDYEVRIFHENILLEIKTLFDDYLPDYLVAMIIDHVLLHEMFHYVTHMEYFLKIRRKKPENRAPAIKKYLKYVNIYRPTDIMAMEEANERRTLAYLKEFYINDAVELPDGVVPMMGGKYDHKLRKEYYDYRYVAGYMEFLMLSFCQQFNTTISGLSPVPDHEVQQKMDDLLYMIKSGQKKRLKYKIED